MPKQQTKKITNKEHLTRRVPRPRGVTMMCMNIRAQDNKDLKVQQIKHLKQTIIQQCVSNNMTLNNRTYTIEQLSRYLKLPIDKIQKYIWDSMNGMGKMFNNKDPKEIARVLFGSSYFKILEIQSLAALQASQLFEAQHGGYVPFLSSAANQAIGNAISATTPLHNLLKIVTDKPDTIIINPILDPEGNLNKSLNQEQALRIIGSSKPSMLADPHLADEQVAKYKAAGLLPDVNARTQDLTKIGIRHDGTHKPSKAPTSHDKERIRKGRRGFEEIEDAEEFIA